MAGGPLATTTTLMTTPSATTALADVLAAVSRTTHQIVADVETRSRSQVASAAAEANEARVQRDKALKELHDAQSEAQAWKEEANYSKAALGQAELTIAHQADSINQQNETIAQLKRELNQWKDQSQNWQEHFLRVEQERCKLASRNEELVLQFTARSTPTVVPNALHTFTPQSRQLNAQAGPSGSNKQRPYPSPARTASSKTQNAEEEPRKALKAENAKPRKSTGASKTSNSTSKAKPASVKEDKPTQSRVKHESEKPLLVAQARRVERLAQNSTPQQQKPTPVKSTVIRRVQAVVHVKREEDTDEEDAPIEEAYMSAMQPQRRRSQKIVADEDYCEQDDHASQSNRHLRPRKPIHYPEESDEGDYAESSEEDELTMGSENRSRSKPYKGEPLGSPAKKKRKTVSDVT